MSERVLIPRHLNVSYTAINSDDEADPSNAPISSEKTKKIPKYSITKNHSAVSKKKKPSYTPAFDPASLPDAQWFEPLIHLRPLHKVYNKLPPALGNLGIIEPINIFQLFFTDDLLEAISVNTNHYAAQKRVEKGLENMRGRAWKDTTLRDIKCWLGIVIYMGVVGLPAVRDYWSTDGLLPSHDICHYMSLTRWEDIKGYLHIASPDTATHDPTGKKLWHQKIDPLLNQVRYAAQSYRIPSSNISIDEAIIRCTGRSSDTYKTPFKPIRQGLKFHCAADHGYIFDFHPTSNKYGPDAFSESTISEHLSDTNSLILEMTSRLPHNHSFNLYMDNYYTNLPIVSLLRRKGIGACGTVRTTSKNYPSELIIPKNSLSQLAYHYRAGVVQSGVATMLWIDNAPVSMMTSIHHLKGRKSEVIKERLKPGPKSTNSAGIKRAQVFTEGEWKAMLNIPTCIEDYNHHMGGVDIADQYRAYYDTQIISRRTWFPIFFWCTDTALIDSFIIFNDLAAPISHKKFRLQVAWSLVLDSITRGQKKRKRTSELDQLKDEEHTLTDSHASKSLYITKRMGLPVPATSEQHLPIQLEGRLRCVWCRWNRSLEGGSGGPQAPQTIWKCESCGYALCLNDKRNCFYMYHKHQE